MNPIARPALAMILGALALAQPVAAQTRAVHTSRTTTARDQTALTARNRAIITAFAHQFYTLRHVRAAFDAYATPDYIQHNPGLADGREAAVADFYRLKDGKIVEHWDVIQPIPAQSADSHPMF